MGKMDKCRFFDQFILLFNKENRLRFDQKPTDTVDTS